jgi:flagellar biosynthesis/type III secretory pathway M-ring protein FliF/YscJ
MIDWVNAILRAVMCFAFLMLIVRPMLVALSRKEVNQLEIEDAAQSSVNSAFAAWRNNHGLHYYDNPEYAEMMASNPNLELPDLSQPPAPALPAPEVAPQEETSAAEVASTEQTHPDSLAGEKTAETDAGASADSVSTEVASMGESSPDQEEEDEDEGSSMDDIKAQMAAEKKKKKQQSIPPELLNANSYEDKLMLVRMIVQQEQGRVSGVLKKMIQG